MKLIRGFIMSWALVVAALAAPHSLDLPFEKLALKNGRTLSSGTIKSYDHATGRVVILAARNVTTIQPEMLPDDVAQRILTMVPPEAKAEQREVKAEQRKRQTTAAKSSAQKQQQQLQARERAQAERKAQADAAAVARARAEVLRTARDRADRFFRYEFRKGSGYTVSIREDIVLEDPVEVAGWPNRYRVNGWIGLEFYDSYGRSFNSTQQRFEVTVVAEPGKSAVVADFSVK